MIIRSPVRNLLSYSSLVLQYYLWPVQTLDPWKILFIWKMRTGSDWVNHHVRTVDVSIKCLQFKPTIEDSLTNKIKWIKYNHRGKGQRNISGWGYKGGLESDVRGVFFQFIMTVRIKRKLGGEEGRCRCYERRRIKDGGNWILSQTWWIGEMLRFCHTHLDTSVSWT